jgi:hypothetical protein
MSTRQVGLVSSLVDQVTSCLTRLWLIDSVVAAASDCTLDRAEAVRGCVAGLAKPLQHLQPGDTDEQNLDVRDELLAVRGWNFREVVAQEPSPDGGIPVHGYVPGRVWEGLVATWRVWLEQADSEQHGST